MSLYAISDLHLGLDVEKPMDIFGAVWVGHVSKIKHNWLEVIKQEDTVLIPGDISWGKTMEEAKPDIDLLNSLPGKKIILEGNHDYWFGTVSKFLEIYPEIFVLRNNFVVYNGYAICGSRGWLCPGDDCFADSDLKIYKRERIRLRISIEAALKEGFDKIILITHFPPASYKRPEPGFLDIIKEYKEIQKVIYGHLHGEKAFTAGIRGMHNGREFILVSGDYLNFVPKLILE